MNDQPAIEDDCQAQGHDFDVITSASSHDPLQIICSGCGRRWKVIADRRPAPTPEALQRTADAWHVTDTSASNTARTTAVAQALGLPVPTAARQIAQARRASLIEPAYHYTPAKAHN